jgi:spore coat polysaccharide biosynthesis predicted glycosyltransferase SpsG
VAHAVDDSTPNVKVLMRADASVEQGSGHVMRCLTLALGLAARGHDVSFLASIDGVSWLSDLVASYGFPVEKSVPHQLDLTQLARYESDWIVIDSYRFDSAEVSGVRALAKTLLLVDGLGSGADADLYLDGNLGAEAHPRSEGKWLAGAQYALVRREWVDLRDRSHTRSAMVDGHVLAVMGGTDPTGSIVAVAKALAAIDRVAQSTVVAPPQWIGELSRVATRVPAMRVIPTTRHLPALVDTAQVVVTASGTSAWDMCTAAKAAVLIAVADNQRDSLLSALAYGVARGVDATRDPSAVERTLIPTLTALVTDESLRRTLEERCRVVFDGQGVSRVCSAMEAAA